MKGTAVVMKARTLTVSINREPGAVYAFASNLEHLPKWATAFARSIKRSGGEWVIETEQGPVKVRMAPKNDMGVLDHYVSPAPGVEVYVPMRVVANGPGSEVIFTIFQYPDMSDEQFNRDIGLVERDLNSLKRVLEA
jgi:hypothetical protein